MSSPPPLPPFIRPIERAVRTARLSGDGFFGGDISGAGEAGDLDAPLVRRARHGRWFRGSLRQQVGEGVAEIENL